MNNPAVEILEAKLLGIVNQLKYNINDSIELSKRLTDLQDSNIGLVNAFVNVQKAIDKLAR